MARDLSKMNHCLVNAPLHFYTERADGTEVLRHIRVQQRTFDVPEEGVTIRLPRITSDMLGCEINIFNATSGTIEINGSGADGTSASGGYFCNLLVPSSAISLKTNSTVTLQKFRELKAKAYCHGMSSNEAYKYGWLVCYANINP